jgi:hypothetical protein
LTKIVIAIVNLEESFNESFNESVYLNGMRSFVRLLTIKADALCVGLTNGIGGPAASLG